jgi:hypothetical protein
VIKVLGADALKELFSLIISAEVGKPKVKAEVIKVEAKPKVKAEVIKVEAKPKVKAEVIMVEAKPNVKKVAKPGKIGQMANLKTFRFKRPRAPKKNGNPFFNFYNKNY